MKSYFALFRMKLIAGMQYRSAAWAGIATQFFWGLMSIMVFQAFYASSSLPMPMTFEQLVCFTWLRQAFLATAAFWSQDNELFEHIQNGNVAYELCRPVSMYPFWFMRLLALRLANTLLRCFPLLIIAALLPSPYKLLPPDSLAAGCLSVLTLCLAVVLVVALSMLIYAATFLLLSPSGPKGIVAVVAEFCSGNLIPIPFMPLAMQRFMDFLPFRYTTDLPYRVYSGSIDVPSALQGVAIQLLWILLLLTIGYTVFSRISRKIVIQGG